MSDWLVSVDLGQTQDYTAISVVEVVRLATGETQRSRRSGKIVERYRSEYHVRHLERPALRTSYPDIVARVGELLDSPELPGAHLVVDATGVGAAVVDLFRSAGRRPIEIKITGGQIVGLDDRGYTVPKRDLAGVLQVLLPSGRLRVADGLKLGKTLADELARFRIKVSGSGTDTYEAARENDHDDLVLSVAMACWYAERGGGRFGLWFEAPEPAKGSVAWEREEIRQIRAHLTRQGNQRGPWYRRKTGHSRTSSRT